MKIILWAMEEKLAAAWEKHCGDFKFVSFHRGSILSLSCDAVVSPTDSFGFMTKGINAEFVQRFGPHVSETLRKIIRTKHHGEMLVGSAELIETGLQRIRFLIAAPTMRVSMTLGPKTINPYLAARASFLLVRYGRLTIPEYEGDNISDHIESIAFPGMGTGAEGAVPPELCAIQMRKAIEDFVLGRFRFPGSEENAEELHRFLFS
jgi:O-acetyl-ADP-ribose deacetylase (regulator of RNase III)